MKRLLRIKSILTSSFVQFVAILFFKFTHYIKVQYVENLQNKFIAMIYYLFIEQIIKFYKIVYFNVVQKKILYTFFCFILFYCFNIGAFKE